jgi:hypothetical protein
MNGVCGTGTAFCDLNQGVRGFENPLAWSVTNGAASLTASTTKNQGAQSLSVVAPAYTTITSIQIATEPKVGKKMGLWVQIPTNQPNSSWHGEITLNVSVPGLNINYSQMVPLLGLATGTWVELAFTLPDDAYTKMATSQYSSLYYAITINPPNGQTGAYLFDDLHFEPVASCSGVLNTTACEDNNHCTQGDTCVNGTCGTAVACNDGNLCTDDSCNPATGCVFTNNHVPCDDKNACTTNDTCSGGSCVGGPPPNCNDGNVCTDDSCNPAAGCVHTNNTTPCNDSNACTTNDTCSGGTCVGGPPPNCDDTNPCTDDSCKPATGCVHTNNTAPCSDGNACTTNDTCAGGTCVGGPLLTCNDGNLCTDDSCNPATGCVFTNNTAACSDGNPCTQGDICGAGVCQPGTPCGAGYTCDTSSGCVDIDECAAGTANCGANATCKNTPGSFTCSCNPGYSGDGHTCTQWCVPITVGNGVQRCVMARADGTVDLFLDPNSPKLDDCSQVDPAPDANYNQVTTNCYRQRRLQWDEPDENWCGPTAGKNLLYWYGADVPYSALGGPMQTNARGTDDLIDFCISACLFVDVPCIVACGAVAEFIPASYTKWGTLPPDLDGALDALKPDGYVRCSDTSDLSLDSLRWSLSNGNPVIFLESTGQWNLHWAAVTGLYNAASNSNDAGVNSDAGNASSQLMLRLANGYPDVCWNDFQANRNIEKVCNGDGCSFVKWFLMEMVGLNPHVYRWTKAGETSAAMGCVASDPYLRASSVSAGSSFTCAQLTSRGVDCWGFNNSGQLGNGSGADSMYPTAVYGLSGVTAIAAGEAHTCAVLSNGSVECWGFNNSGQLGNGSGADSMYPVLVSHIPTSVYDPTGRVVASAIGVAAGTDHTCAWLSDGVVACWGGNNSGQLGNGSGSNSYAPGLVAD